MNKHFPPVLVLTWCAFPPTGRLAGQAGGGRPAGGERLAAGGGGGVVARGGVGIYQWITAREILGKRGMR